MEEKTDQIKVLKPNKTKISFFKRRKKPREREFSKIKKTKRFKKFTSYFLVFLVIVLVITGILYLLKTALVFNFTNSEMNILSPNAEPLPSTSKILSLIQSSGLDVSNVNFSTNSADIIFDLNKQTVVKLTRGKNVKDQLNLVSAITEQLASQSKRAIYIDLRYNKPIVSF